MSGSELAKDFLDYCLKHPEQRFWQALRNWSGASSIHFVRVGKQEPEDAFYFEGKDSQ